MKAQVKYEFGVKCTIALTNARAAGGPFAPCAKTILGTPWDGNTLATQTDKGKALTGHRVRRAYVDRGYCGHKLVREVLDANPYPQHRLASDPTRTAAAQRHRAGHRHLFEGGRTARRKHRAGAIGDAINAA